MTVAVPSSRRSRLESSLLTVGYISPISTLVLLSAGRSFTKYLYTLTKTWYTFDTIKSVSNCIKQNSVKMNQNSIKILSKGIKPYQMCIKSVSNWDVQIRFWYSFDLYQIISNKFDTLLIQQYKGSMACIWYAFDTHLNWNGMHAFDTILIHNRSQMHWIY